MLNILLKVAHGVSYLRQGVAFQCVLFCNLLWKLRPEKAPFCFPLHSRNLVGPGDYFKTITIIKKMGGMEWDDT